MAAFPGSDCAAWPRGSAGWGLSPGGCAESDVVCEGKG